MDASARPPAVARALRHIADPGADDFESVALEVFAFQFERNEPYRRLCVRRGRTPGTVTRSADIPSVPARAFRHARLACGEARVVFETSGTTSDGEPRGRHHLPDTALYEAALEPVFRAHLLPDRPSMRILSLIPRGRDFPRSSLSFMTDRILARFGTEGSDVFMSGLGLDDRLLRLALSGAESTGEPVMLLGTAFAFVHVLDGLAADGIRFRLPEGSRLMDTGGFKGRSREVSREELLAAYDDRFDIPAARVAGEYGMTELSSQRYERALSDAFAGEAPAGREYVGPPWLVTRALDPETLEETPAGTPGLLAHLDLANAWTVAAVLTEDLGTVTGRGVTLLGRARGAQLRGCSLATEEILGSG